MESDVPAAKLPSIAPRPTEPANAPWTLIVSVIGVAILAQGSVALPPGPTNELLFVLGSLLLIPVLAALLLPWQRYRGWMTLVPSLAFIPAATLLILSLGSTASGLTPLFMAPVLWTALYQGTRQTSAVVAAVIVAVAVLAMSQGDAGSLLVRRAVLLGVMGVLVAVVTLGLRAALGHAVAAREELLRQANALSDAAQRLNSLHRSDAVIAEACRLAAVMMSPPGVVAQRGSYLTVEGDLVHVRSQFDTSFVSVPKVSLLSENPQLARVVQTGRPEMGANAGSGMSPGVEAALRKAGITHGAWIPVAPNGAIHGVLSISTRGHAISDDLFERAITLGHIVELALANVLMVEQSDREATTDALTGLANRRGFDQGVEHLRGRRRFAVLYLDIDDLKLVNDRHGHAAGDALLRGVGQAASSVMRKGDLLARVGGDEFAAFLADCAEEGARQAAHRILEALDRTTVAGMVPRVSIGIAMGDDTSDLSQVLAQSDAAMYTAKRKGGKSFSFARGAVIPQASLLKQAASG
ncbi:MAG: GGDEF domain-containing protein [Candidatus Dormiibacterota bacterium]